MQRRLRKRAARYLQFTLQRLGDLTRIPNLLAHAVSNLETGSSTIFSGWDAATTSNQQITIQTLEGYTFGLRRAQ